MTKIKKPIETQPEVDTYGFENDLIDVDTNVDIEIIQEPSTNAKSIIDAISSGVDSIADKDIGTSNKSKSASRTEFNKNDLISIKSITINKLGSDDEISIIVGDGVKPTSGQIVTSTEQQIRLDVDGVFGYFNIQKGSLASYISSIVIEYNTKLSDQDKADIIIGLIDAIGVVS